MMNNDTPGLGDGQSLRPGNDWLMPQGLGGWIAAAFTAAACAGLGLYWTSVLALPNFAFMLPVLLLWSARRGGAFSATLGLTALTMALSYSTPVWTWGAAPLVILPVMLFRYAAARAKEFPLGSFKVTFAVVWTGCFACLLGGGLLAFRMVWLRLGESPIQYALASLEKWLSTSPQGGAALLDAYRFGLARLENQPFALQFGSSIWIAPSQSRELINSLITTMRTLAESYLPGAFVTSAVLGATLCASISPDNSPSGAPPFEQWRISLKGAAGIFMSVSVALVILNFAVGGMFAMPAGLAIAAVQIALTIQGAAVIEFRLARRSMPMIARRVLIVICFSILGIVCAMLGLADMLWDLRRLKQTETDDEII